MRPLPIVVRLAQFCLKSYHVLDIGTGTGRNALFLAEMGLRIDAIDRSSNRLTTLESTAATRGLAVRVFLHDVAQTDPDFRNYSIVLCTLLLHFLSPERAHSLLSNARAQARPGTLHALGAITRDGDFFERSSSAKRFYPEPNELRRTYSTAGWEILEAYEERREMYQKFPCNGAMHGLVSFIIARR